MQTEFLCISVLRVAAGPRVKLAGCKSALNPRWFILLTAVVLVLVVFFVALWFILRGDFFLSCLVLFCSCVCQSF